MSYFLFEARRRSSRRREGGGVGGLLLVLSYLAALTWGADGSLKPAPWRAAQRDLGNPRSAKLAPRGAACSPRAGAESSGGGGGAPAEEAAPSEETPPSSPTCSFATASSDSDAHATTTLRKARTYARRLEHRAAATKEDKEGEEVAATWRRSAADGDASPLLNANVFFVILMRCAPEEGEVCLAVRPRVRGPLLPVSIAFPTSDAAAMAALHARDDVVKDGVSRQQARAVVLLFIFSRANICAPLYLF